MIFHKELASNQENCNHSSARNKKQEWELLSNKVIEPLDIFQGRSEGDQFCCMRLTGCSHFRIFLFHVSCCDQAEAAAGGVFLFQILVYVLLVLVLFLCNSNLTFCLYRLSQYTFSLRSRGKGTRFHPTWLHWP